MDYQTFFKQLKTICAFNDDNFPEAPEGQCLVFKDSEGKMAQIKRIEEEFHYEDTDYYFKVSVLGDVSGPDEIVHIRQEGKYFDHVFALQHNRLDSLYTLEEEEESNHDATGYEPEDFKALSPEERIAAMPFTKNLLAKSLDDFLAGISLVDRENYKANAR